MTTVHIMARGSVIEASLISSDICNSQSYHFTEKLEHLHASRSLVQ